MSVGGDIVILGRAFKKHVSYTTAGKESLEAVFAQLLNYLYRSLAIGHLYLCPVFWFCCSAIRLSPWLTIGDGLLYRGERIGPVNSSADVF